MDASGVRNSWDIELNSAVRRRSDSASSDDSLALSASRALSKATAASPAQVSISLRSSRVTRASRSWMLRMPTTASRVFNGTCMHFAPGNVSVKRPALSACSKAHSATAISALSASRALSPCCAAIDNEPFIPGSKTATGFPMVSAA